MRIDEPTRTEGAKTTSNSPIGRPALATADYAGEIAALGIDPAQADEFLQIIWDIMGRFVQLGIDVEICEQIFESGNIDFADRTNAIDSVPPPPTTEKPSGGKRDA